MTKDMLGAGLKIIKIEPWERRGFSYHSKVTWTYEGQNLVYSINRKLGLISYQLIKLYHGIEKLNAMASHIPEDYK